MKFEVKVGQPFEGQVTVNVTVDTAEKKDFSFKKAVAVVLAAVAVATAIAAVGYGVATGDYSFAKSVADYGKEVVEVAVKAAAKKSE